MRLRTSARVALLALAASTAYGQEVVTVTNTDDVGPGSLRQALVDVALAPGTHVHFAIPGEGVHTITPGTPLPAISASTLIDGSTQPGASCTSDPPALLVEIDGGLLGGGADALVVSSNGVAIRGLVVNSAPADGIRVIQTAGFSLTCSFVGTDATGTLDFGNGGNGVSLDGANAVQIGGTLAGDGNLLASNTLSGVLVAGASATDVRIEGNRIGVSTAGDPLPNGGSGVLVQGGAHDNDVGTIGGGNEIRGNEGGGVTVAGATSLGNSIRGNAMAGNASIGIDLLGAFFEDANDPADPDAGPNRLQNTPVLESATALGGGDLQVTYSVDTDPANATYPLAIDLYAADFEDEEGETYLGTVTYAGVDFAAGSVTQVAAGTPVVSGQRIVATATDAAGNTSEFSDDAVTVPEPAAWAASLVALGAVAARRRRRA